MVIPPRGPARLRAFSYAAEGEPVRETWVEVAVGDEWTVAYRLVPQEGRPVVAEVRVYPRERGSDAGRWSHDAAAVPLGGLPSSVARSSIVTQDVLNAYPRIVRQMQKQHGAEAIERAFLTRHGFSRKAKEPPKHPGRAGRPDLFYAQLAREYVELLGGPVPVNKALAKQRSYSETYTRSLVHEARRRGLLTLSPPGRAGGTLTEKARDLLRDADEGRTK